MKRLKRFQFGITPSGKKFVIDTSKDMEDQNFMKSDLLNPAEKEVLRKHWKKTLWALGAADKINFKSMN